MNEELSEEDENPTIIICNMIVINMFMQNEKEVVIEKGKKIECEDMVTDFDSVSNRFKVLSNIQSWDKCGQGSFHIRLMNQETYEMESKEVKVNFIDDKLILSI